MPSGEEEEIVERDETTVGHRTGSKLSAWIPAF
jgi:hypothetical protein